MDEHAVAPASARPLPRKRRATGPYKRLRLKLRRSIVNSRMAMQILASLLSGWLRLVRLTNSLEMRAPASVSGSTEPAILALWHGQHLLAPAVYPRGQRSLVAMVSRSVDAELNAMVLERFGVQAVRGSGGRDDRRHGEKGGARALIALKRALDAGKNVCMIADIPHGKPREAGMGVVLLARLTGRPIVGAAIATSRRRVLHNTWDSTTINLPFGRCAVVASEPVYVPADAGEAEMERKRQDLTDAINAATAAAYQLLDSPGAGG
jgi:lysophospholipid acyltransferase (LPLAT)-like uncharacterized protein